MQVIFLRNLLPKLSQVLKKKLYGQFCDIIQLLLLFDICILLSFYGRTKV